MRVVEVWLPLEEDARPRIVHHDRPINAFCKFISDEIHFVRDNFCSILYFYDWVFRAAPL